MVGYPHNFLSLILLRFSQNINRVVFEMLTMFPLFSCWYNNSCYGNEPISRKTHLERKLRFLKTMRDDLETKLAGLNAAITNVEQQVSHEDTTQV
jgi:hypothetical protein